MEEKHLENKLMRVIATMFLLAFCSYMFYKFLFD